MLGSKPDQLFHTILRGIRSSLVGQDHVAERLALAGMRHAIGVPGERVLLIGPTASGKTTATRALARASGIRHLQHNAASASQVGWHGRSLAEALGELLDEAGSLEELDRSLILLEEIDKLATLDLDANSSAFSYRRGKQENLLGLLGGSTEIPIFRSVGANCSWKDPKALIIATGVFPELRKEGVVTPSDLVELGMMPELVGRLGTILRMESHTPDTIMRVLKMKTQPIRDFCDRVGYPLHLADGVLQQIAALVSDPRRGVDPRTGITWLRDAVDRKLVDAFRSGLPTGRSLIVEELNIEIPPSRSGDSVHDQHREGRTVGFRASPSQG